jgi:phosphatidylglycerophosphatase A
MTARVADFAFMRPHVSHWLALGFGSGLAKVAPGTAGTLFAWASFWALNPWLGRTGWVVMLVSAWLVGMWACTACARRMGVADPSSIVWDEIVAFWWILWVIDPAPWWHQALSFGVFRYFDAAKPGPVRWADALFKPHASSVAGDTPPPIGWKQGLGIMLDDAVAAVCTVLTLLLAAQAWSWCVGS